MKQGDLGGVDGTRTRVENEQETPAGAVDRASSPAAESSLPETVRDQSGHVATAPATELVDPLDVLRMTLPDPAPVVDLATERARRARGGR